MYRPVRIVVAMMLSALFVIPAGVGMAQGLRFNRSKNRAASNSGKLSRSMTLPNSPGTPTFTNKVFKPAVDLRNSTRLSNENLSKTRPPSFFPSRSIPSFNSPSGASRLSNRLPWNQFSSRVPVKSLPPNLQVKPLNPGTQLNLNRLKPLNPVIDPSKFIPRTSVADKGASSLPAGKLNGITKLAGIKKFEGLVGQIGDHKVTPIKLGEFDRKFGDILRGADLKMDLVKKQHAKKFAIQKLSLQPHCHWWIDFVIGCNWHWNHCHWWDYCYTPAYWHCWTPCYYNVVYCPPVNGGVSSSWYFGIDCILIPDMTAYGIQAVKPNSPAAFAGLKQGDLIVSINGNGIADESVLSHAIHTSGGLLELGVIRDGSDQPVLVEVALQRIQKLSY